MRTALIIDQKVLVITLATREDDPALRPSGKTLNAAFEASPADILIVTRAGRDAQERIDQAVSVLSRSESIRSAYHHGIFAITKEAWRVLGTFRNESDAELAFIEILEANRRLRVCDQTIQGSLRELRLRLEDCVAREERSSTSQSEPEMHRQDTTPPPLSDIERQ
ncbi:MAG: hypothetical protein RL518_25 [Pseudomonadota bacterium]|jgi:hypothetical protein